MDLWLYHFSHTPTPPPHTLTPQLRTEPRALRLLGKPSTAEQNPQPITHFFKDNALFAL